MWRDANNPKLDYAISTQTFRKALRKRFCTNCPSAMGASPEPVCPVR